MDETKNWKVITTDEEGTPILKYDPHRDETVNVITGEVIQGHWLTMTEHACIQEPTITQLQVHQDYETQRIDELKIQIDKMDKKLDKVLEGFNELKLQSNKDDNQLELRLKAIETELELQKQVSIENHNRVSQLLALVGVGLTIITILINVYFKMIWYFPLL